MINEQLLGAVRRMTESRLRDMVNQPERYSLEEVQAAKIVIQERRLQSSDDKPPFVQSSTSQPEAKHTQQKLNESNEEVKKTIDTNVLTHEAQRMLERKVPLEEIERQFRQRGLPTDQIETAIHAASLNADLTKKVEKPEPKSKGGVSYFWIFFIIYLIIKYVIRSSNN